jgi:hypothetical protein
MAHNHGIQYQVKVIYEDGTEELSEWIDQGKIAFTMAALRKPQIKACWLRERSVAIPFCPLCLDRETEVNEYPVADSLSPRTHPHDSSYLVLMGEKDPHALPVSALIPPFAEPHLPSSTDVALVTELMGGSSAAQKLPSKRRILRRITPRRILAKGGGEPIHPAEPKPVSGGSKTP